MRPKRFNGVRFAWLCAAWLLSLACTDGSRVVAQEAAASAASAPRASEYILEYDAIHHPVIARKGMVTSQNEIASRVGAEILRRGGNAIDAAVATGFALAVTLPRAGNLGGGGFMLVHLAKENRTVALEYYGMAPDAVRPDLLLGANGKVDPDKRYSWLGVAVPGTVAGFYAAQRRYGRLRWAEVVAPAVRLARRGIPVSDDMAWALDRQRAWLAEDPAVRDALFRSDASAPSAGERLVQRDLAWSLTQIQRHGADAFYRGAIAERLLAAMRMNGGIITAEDLQSYHAREQSPLWGDYRGYRIACVPPPSAGVIFAELMNILEVFPMREYGQNSVAGLHVLAEAMKLVTADRYRFAGGYPQIVPPVSGLNDKRYARERAKLIRPDTVLKGNAEPGDPFRYESRDTTHFSVVDSDGNAVSNTFTLGSSFGAHVMAPGTGFLLNDTMGNFAWRRDEQHPANAPEPRKRAVSTITPIIVFKDDELWLVSGTPGGSRIIGAMAQLLVNLIDHDLNIAEATARPRVFQGRSQDALEFEPGFPPDVLALLAQKGHRVESGQTIGSTQSIVLDDGILYGGADTRRPDARAVAAD